MFQIVLVCDRCNAEIARGDSALEIRRVSAAIYRRRGGEDLCMKMCRPREDSQDVACTEESRRSGREQADCQEHSLAPGVSEHR
jgi:hypothetical protein